VDAIAAAMGEVLGGKWHVKCVHAEPTAGGPAVAQKPRAEPTTYTRPTQQQQSPEPPRTAAPAPPPPADEPPPPEPPADDYYEDDVDVATVTPPEPPVANPEADMVKLLTDKLGARPLDR
jgi:DNA polymerase-3 subunit gamma/tau